MDWMPQADVPLAPLTTWKIGGRAEWFASPADLQELSVCLGWAATQDAAVTIIGRGSNILVPDEGLSGLVICLRSFNKDLCGFREGPDGTGLLEASAGMSLPRLAKAVAQQGFSGYEFYIGIPGTVGGAVVMNAGFGPGDERQTANRCREVQVIAPEGKLQWYPYTRFHPVYRHTDLVGGEQIVVGARFSLGNPSTKEAIRATTAEHLAMRKARQPLTRPTAGSVFKGTPEGVPAAVYIDRCGLKGKRIGGALVSPKHANWIENDGSATAMDVLELIRFIQETVKDKEGILLETEVRFLR